MPLVHLAWPYGCKHLAMVAGSWSKWHPQVLVPLRKQAQDGSLIEVWSTEIRLPDNVTQTFRFKFIVDGDWLYDSALPHVPNHHGSFDNIIEVHYYFGNNSTYY